MEAEIEHVFSDVVKEKEERIRREEQDEREKEGLQREKREVERRRGELQKVIIFNKSWILRFNRTKKLLCLIDVLNYQ